jgi:hypothetical protein
VTVGSAVTAVIKASGVILAAGAAAALAPADAADLDRPRGPGPGRPGLVG